MSICVQEAASLTESIVFPYQKQQLLSYPAFFISAVVVAIVLVAVGLVMRVPTGFAFGVLTVPLMFDCLIKLLQWNAEPTARRQYFTAFLIVLTVGISGWFLIDLVAGTLQALVE